MGAGAWWCRALAKEVVFVLGWLGYCLGLQLEFAGLSRNYFATNPAFLAAFRGVIVEIQRKTRGAFENISVMSYT